MYKNILIVVGITILFLVMSITPSIAIDDVKKSSLPKSDGNTLYVGGFGPDNYTRIQDAIYNASDGDTVFVYDDSSPYYENVILNKSIKLVGENKDTTIIDGNRKGDIITINADEVTIIGFSIVNATNGIIINTNRNQIIGNNILNQYHHGIFFNADDNDELAASLNKVKNNNISKNCFSGLKINDFYGYVHGSGDKNSIIDNIFTENGCGIWLESTCSNNLIRGNIIMFNKEEGINLNVFLHGMNRVVRNHIEQNEVGVRALGPSFNIIRNNNIMNNSINATFLTIQIRLCNLWIGNYWGRPYLNPKLLYGLRELLSVGMWWGDSIFLPCFAFDIRPALNPYEI